MRSAFKFCDSIVRKGEDTEFFVVLQTSEVGESVVGDVEFFEVGEVIEAGDAGETV